MKNIFLFLTLLVLSVSAKAQQNQVQQDSTKTEKLDEVLVKVKYKRFNLPGDKNDWVLIPREK